MKTLRDAADHIEKLPKAQQQLPHRQAALDALITAAKGLCPLLHARVEMVRAMNRGKERVFRTDRKRDAFGQAEAKSDE